MVSKRNGRQMRYVIYFGPRKFGGGWLCLAKASHSGISPSHLETHESLRSSM